jgi:hypothetical protein
MIIINTSEDFVNFDQRANIVKEQLEELGPVRVEDLPSLFLRHNIPNVTSNKQITDKPRQKGSRKRVNKS